MHFRRNPIYLLCLVLLCTTGLSWALLSGTHYYISDSQTQSSFFQGYTFQHVQNVIDQLKPSPVSSDAGVEGASGRESATGKRNFHFHFAIQPEKAPDLLTAVADDMVAQLMQSGATNVNESGDSTSGFRVTYRLGHAIGIATLYEYWTDKFAGHYTRDGSMVPPPAGENYMAANINISEQWFPDEGKAIQQLRTIR